MRDLLIKDEFRRLGSRAGASDVKNHVFFKHVSWALLRNCEPPIIPVLTRPPGSSTTTSSSKKGNYPDGLGLDNFRSLRDSNSLDLASEIVVEDGSDERNPFHDFETLKIDRS